MECNRLAWGTVGCGLLNIGSNKNHFILTGQLGDGSNSDRSELVRIFDVEMGVVMLKLYEKMMGGIGSFGGVEVRKIVNNGSDLDENGSQDYRG